MPNCNVCGKRREEYEMHNYDSGLSKCKEHSIGFANVGKSVYRPTRQKNN